MAEARTAKADSPKKLARNFHLHRRTFPSAICKVVGRRLTDMDVLKMIQGLLDERDRIDATIAKLEALRSQGATRVAAAGRRGRKAMSMTEREEVSRRMRNYWDQRRLAREAQVDVPVEEERAAKAEAAKAGAGK